MQAPYKYRSNVLSQRQKLSYFQFTQEHIFEHAGKLTTSLAAQLQKMFLFIIIKCQM